MKAPKPFPNSICWQPDSRIQVMNPVALGVRKSVFDATHYPCPIRKLNVVANQNASTAYSEKALCGDFLQHGVERLFCVAVGDSGTGKSHLIRWLCEQAEVIASKKAKIIRIPRHASNLADVLRIVISDFKGEAVESIRRELQSTSNVTERGARERVLDELAFVLAPGTRQQSALKFPDNDLHQEIILPFVPALLRDASIRNFLCVSADGVAGRLAQHVLGQRHERDGITPVLKWAASDLHFPMSVIVDAGSDAKELASSLLNDPHLQQATAAVLNQALEEALPGLVGLKRGNLRNAFLEIRKQLKREKRELLLFLEDLSVSQGLDAELLESLIVKASEEDNQLCTLRSIIGVTHNDFQSLPSNIRGRIDIAVSFDVSFGGSKSGDLREADLSDFASRYLNAVRHRLTDLDEWSKSAKTGEELPSFCETSACPNRDACHKIFGEVHGRGLYPLNPIAITRLYQKLHGEERVAFNPRAMVRGVLDEFLHRAEAQLPIGIFPGTDFRDFYKLAETSANVQLDINKRHGSQAPRLLTALEIYSAQPNAGKLPHGLGEIFGLPKIASPSVDVSPQKPESTPDPIQTRALNTADEFDRWLNQKRVDDTNVNRWRDCVFEAMKGAREWDTDPHGPFFTQLFQKRFIHFEGQATQRAGDIKLEIRPDPEIATALRGLVRGFGNEDEALLAVHWVEKWNEDICKQIKHHVEASGDLKPLDAAVHLLALGAILRGRVSEEMSTESFAAAVFAEWNEPPSAGVSSSPWSALQESFVRWAPKVRDWLLQQIGAGKGGAVASMMLDGAQISGSLASSRRRIAIDSFHKEFGDKWARDTYGPVVELGRKVASQFHTALEHETQFCNRWIKSIDSACGDQSLRSLGDSLKAAFVQGIEAGVFNNLQLSDAPLRCEMFTNGNLEALVKTARGMINEKAQNRRIIFLAHLDRTMMADAEKFLSLAWSELGNAEAKLTRLHRDIGTDDLNTITKEAEKELSMLCESLEKLTGGQGNE